jgi:predicted porin
MNSHNDFQWIKAVLLGCAMQLNPMTLWAQSPNTTTVRVYGDLDVGVGRVHFPGLSASTWQTSGFDAQSYFGIAGSEALGGDWAAQFKLESYISLDNGVAANTFYPTDPFWGRSATVGLKSGRWGALNLGRNPNPFYQGAVAHNAFGESFLSPALTVASFRQGHVVGRAHDNGIRYDSPVIGGFSFSALLGLKEAASNGNDHSATLAYAQGPWAGVVGTATVKTGLAEGKKSSIGFYAASYDFGVLRLFAEAATQRDTEAEVKSRAFDLGAKVPLGPWTLKVSSARIKQTDLAGGQARTERVTSLGGEYLVSKRTKLYGGVKYDKVTDLDAAKSVIVGLRHSF